MTASVMHKASGHLPDSQCDSGAAVLKVPLVGQWLLLTPGCFRGRLCAVGQHHDAVEPDLRAQHPGDGAHEGVLGRVRARLQSSVRFWQQASGRMFTAQGQQACSHAIRPAATNQLHCKQLEGLGRGR